MNPFGISREKLGRFGAEEFQEFVRNVILGNPVRRHLKNKTATPMIMLEMMVEDICHFYLGQMADDNKIDGENKMVVMEKNGIVEDVQRHQEIVKSRKDNSKNHIVLEKYTKVGGKL
jgi:hypothetical protein